LLSEMREDVYLSTENAYLYLRTQAIGGNCHKASGVTEWKWNST